VSVVTVAELRIGVLVEDTSIRAQRLRTLSEVESLQPLPVVRV